MPAPLHLRLLTAGEQHELQRLVRCQTAEARLRDRARICWLSHGGKSVRTIVDELGRDEKPVLRWIRRFNADGLAGLSDASRTGRPATYTPAEIGTVVATSLTPPQALGLPFGSWTLDRLAAYLSEEPGIAIKRSRIGEVRHAEGLRWRTEETWFGERPDPAFAEKRGPSSRSTSSPRRTAS